MQSYLVNLDGCILYPGFRVYFNKKHENDALHITLFLEDGLKITDPDTALIFLYSSLEDMSLALGKEHKDEIHFGTFKGKNCIFALTPAIVERKEYLNELKEKLFEL